jgi:tetratricopeptide (TPR) repeat protein
MNHQLLYSLGVYVFLSGVTLLLPGCGSSSNTPAGPTFKHQFEEAQRVANPEARARRLLKLAFDQHKGQDASGSKKTLAAAIHACSGVKEPVPRCTIYVELAGVQVSLGNKLEAGQALNTAQEAAQGITSPEEHARALCQIATIQGQKLKSKNEASDALDAAETLLEEIQDPTGRTLVQVAIIKACAATELNKQGQRVLVTALAETKSQTDAATRADAYTHLAEAQLAMKQKEAAQETLGAALESSGEIERVYKRVYTLCDIATAYSRAGDKAQAQKTLAQAEKLIAKVPEPDLQSDATEHVNKLAERLW